jgi:hypothetical protein
MVCAIARPHHNPVSIVLVERLNKKLFGVRDIDH